MSTALRAIAIPIAIVALFMALAAGPFASVAQANEPAQEATPSSGSSLDLEALSELADMTTVTDLAAVINEPDAPYYIEPMVRARIAEYVEAQVQAAKSGVPATVPDTVAVSIYAKSLAGDLGAG